MTVEVIKANRIVRTILGLLERESTLPSLVWRDAGGDFRGAKDDTISLRLPAYFKARKRDLRSGDTRVKDSLVERKVDVTLDTDIYGVIPITDEELTLDIESFNEQIVVPVAGGIVRELVDTIAAEMSGAAYANTVTGFAAEPYGSVVDARKLLNDARVPMAGRALVLGSALEAAVLKDDQFVRVDQSGSSAVMREAQIGRIAGFPVFTEPAFAPDEGYAFHRTAYVMSTRAPFVPRGVPWGASMSFGGFALRVAQAVDPDALVDNFHADAWVGTNVVLDDGYFNSDGQFTPNEIATGAEVDIQTSAAADDIIDATAHGFVEDDRVVFSSLTGGTGLSANQPYYVTATSLAANTFRVSETLGGADVDFSTDITDGKVRKGGAPLLVRAVKLEEL